MDDLPLHSIIIHLPMGLAPLVPLFALGIGWAVWKDKLPRRAWLIVVVLQALVLGGALVAQETGEDEEERVESVVPEDDIHAHEEAAEVFTVSAGLTLAVALAALLLPKAGLRLGLMGVTIVAAGISLGLGIRTGHAGGHILHEHMVRPELTLPAASETGDD